VKAEAHHRFRGDPFVSNGNTKLKTILTTVAMMIFSFANYYGQTTEGRVSDVACTKPPRAAGLTREEQALFDKGLVMQTYNPDEHSRHFITRVDAVTDGKTGKERKLESPRALLCFVFGKEDAEPARKEGRSMAESHRDRSQAEQFLFAQGREKYHDHFFTRCYVEEGLNAYDKAAKSH